jgi:HSP20 family protein
VKLDLSRWNPFKFLRKTPEEKRTAHSSSALMASMADPWPAPLPELPRLFSMSDPFRMMQGMLRDPFAGFGQPDRWFGDFSPSVFEPRIDVVDDGDALRITAELPGMDRQDVQIQIEDDCLVLQGEKRLESKSEEKGSYRLERAFGSFMRVIPLPDGVDVDRADAKFDKGVLTVRLPKLAAEKSSVRRIEIK